MIGIILAEIFFIIFIATIVIKIYFDRPENKGKRGEKHVAKILKSHCNSDHDYLLNDIILYNPQNNNSSQVDHILICSHGIFIIETKNYSGRIYGSDRQRDWMQVLAGGKVKNTFYSPLKQNATHIYLIRSIIGKKFSVYGFVVFVQGNIDNVYSPYVYTLHEFSKHMEQICAGIPALTTEQRDEIYQKISDYRDHFNISEQEHLKNIAKKQKDLSVGICPRCGGKLVMRAGKYGNFYGCSNYPKCTFTKQLT